MVWERKTTHLFFLVFFSKSRNQPFVISEPRILKTIDQTDKKILGLASVFFNGVKGPKHRSKSGKSRKTILLVILCDLQLGCWWPPTRGWKGHIESSGSRRFFLLWPFFENQIWVINLHSGKVTWLAGKSPIFSREYIFNPGAFFAM